MDFPDIYSWNIIDKGYFEDNDTEYIIGEDFVGNGKVVRFLVVWGDKWQLLTTPNMDTKQAKDLYSNEEYLLHRIEIAKEIWSDMNN